MSPEELVALVCCDLGAIVRGRALPAGELGARLQSGVGWVPANLALTPLGGLAQPNPFGSTGDLRLLPDRGAHVRVGAEHPHTPLRLTLCDIVEMDGSAWECCPRRFLREALAELERELGARVLASFEHEFQLLSREPPSLPFSLEAMRRGEPFAGELMGALAQAGLAPEMLTAEFAAHQFEVPVEAVEGIGAADRAVLFREVVRELARRHGLRASFAALVDPAGAGNGVHIHVSLLDAEGGPLLYDPSRPAGLSELGGAFAAGILSHARALSALTAPSPPSAARLVPHRWSAGAVCLAERNREALLRIPPLSALPGSEEAYELRLEYRGADACANPYLALGAVVRAGLDGVRRGLPTPAILDRDPAGLTEEEAVSYGVGGLPRSLEEALAALGADATVRGWMPPLLHEAYLALKRAELEAVASLDLGEQCERYAAVY